MTLDAETRAALPALRHGGAADRARDRALADAGRAVVSGDGA